MKISPSYRTRRGTIIKFINNKKYYLNEQGKWILSKYQTHSTLQEPARNLPRKDIPEPKIMLSKMEE